MPAAPPDAAGDELAPIDYLVVAFPDGKVGGESLRRLSDLVDAGAIRILDVEFARRGDDGSVTVVEPGDVVSADGVDLSFLEGAASGLLDETDLGTLAGELEPGEVAVTVVLENVWLLSLIEPWRRAGARLLDDGGMPADDLVAALDATEPS